MDKNGRQKSLRRYCMYCKRNRPKRMFSGKGRRLHICKKCQGLPEEKKQLIREKREVASFLWHSRVSKQDIARLEQLSASTNAEIAELAGIVLEVGKAYPHKHERIRWLPKEQRHLLDQLGLEPERHIQDFGIEDLKRHPVWTWWTVSDEDILSPVSFEANRVLKTRAYEDLFIFCQIELKDGTCLDGEVAIDGSDGETVSTVTFYRDDDSLWIGPGDAFLGGLDWTMDKLTNWFGKPIDQIIPLRYETEFVQAKDGMPIAGVIDPREWS